MQKGFMLRSQILRTPASACELPTRKTFYKLAAFTRFLCIVHAEWHLFAWNCNTYQVITTYFVSAYEFSSLISAQIATDSWVSRNPSDCFTRSYTHLPICKLLRVLASILQLLWDFAHYKCPLRIITIFSAIFKMVCKIIFLHGILEKNLLGNYIAEKPL